MDVRRGETSFVFKIWLNEYNKVCYSLCGPGGQGGLVIIYCDHMLEGFFW